MPARDTYMLHILSRQGRERLAVGRAAGRLPGGDSRRFTDPEALLAHLRTTACVVERPAAPTDTTPGAAGSGDDRR